MEYQLTKFETVGFGVVLTLRNATSALKKCHF
jgi:hypothetical protein